MDSEIVLDFNNQKNLFDEINKIALSLRLTSRVIINSEQQFIVRYNGIADGIYSLGKYIGEKKYLIENASK
ncbi:MAG: hypothetical protein IPG78_03735 [Ignavibacteria bacterium]|nr:hypothetical protein [Ignavibacteria bacterium]